jgi:hypothetical protein
MTGSTITSKRASITMRQRGVYHVLKHFGSMTDTDLVAVYNCIIPHLNRGERYPQQSPSGIRTRRNELVVKGYVEATGDRVKLPSGKYTPVWRAV